MQQQKDKQPKNQTQPQLQKKQKSAQKQPALSSGKKRNFWLGILTAAVIGFGGWSLIPPAAPDIDNISNVDKAQITEQFNAIDTFAVERISNAEEIQQAITSMGLSPEQKTVLENQVKNGDIDMAWIQAWDNAAEDGDVLKFESQSYKITTTLMNQPVVFALPLAPGTNHVKVTGIHDGGGGITASVITSTGATSVPVINEGMSYTLPIK